MIDEIDSTDSTLRALLWRALKNYSSLELLNLVRDSDYIVRTAAAKQLHFRPESEVFDAVLKLCSSPIEFEREIGAFILGQLGTPQKPFRDQSVPTLLNLIQDKSADVRAAAAAAFGHLYYKDMPVTVEKALFDAASDNDVIVRCCVASSLGGAANVEQAEKILLQLVSDLDEEVREYAELGLDILLDR
jgi:HEAT repeat protein